MPLDFYISISISDDKLSAYLLISNADDTFQSISWSIRRFGSKESYCSWCKSSCTCAKLQQIQNLFYLKKTLIATGTKPIEGQNGYIKLFLILMKMKKNL